MCFILGRPVAPYFSEVFLVGIYGDVIKPLDLNKISAAVKKF